MNIKSEHLKSSLNILLDIQYLITLQKKSVSEEILSICKKYLVGYVKLPKQEFLPKGYGSYSHGIACNYHFNKYIKDGGAKYFMLLDHDIFLIDDFDISTQFDQQFFYGTKQ